MKVNLLPAATAVLLAIAGLALLFAPVETASCYGITTAPASSAFIQLFGAALLGLAAMNWTSRFSLLGGLHGRAIVAANFFHFFIGACVTLRALVGRMTPAIAMTAVVYVIAAVLHGISFYTTPKGPS